MEPYKRFMLFAYDNYYPSGGQTDVLGSFDTLEEARNRTYAKEYQYFEIFDRIEGLFIKV